MFALCSHALCVMKGGITKQAARAERATVMTELPSNFNSETAPPTLTIDWDAYLPFFEDEDISEADKHEMIEALWSIVVNFVDLGFGVHPVQQACGQAVSLAELPKTDVLELPLSTEPKSQSKASNPPFKSMRGSP